MKILSIKGIVKTYKKRTVVNDINLEVKQGEIVGLLGPNGAGKSTTFYIIVGLIKPKAGQVFIDDKDITYFPTFQRAKYGIGYLPQEPSIFRKLTVKDNIMAILETMKMNKAEREARLNSLMQEFGITHLANNMAYTLSGGERRRVEIARALVINPSFLLLDEPFVGIDPITVGEIKKLILQLKKKGLGILITDHNVRETLSVTDRAYIIYEGKVLMSGDAKSLSKDKKARELYLGEEFTL